MWNYRRVGGIFFFLIKWGLPFGLGSCGMKENYNDSRSMVPLASMRRSLLLEFKQWYLHTFTMKFKLYQQKKKMDGNLSLIRGFSLFWLFRATLKNILMGLKIPYFTRNQFWPRMLGFRALEFFLNPMIHSHSWFNILQLLAENPVLHFYKWS